MFSLGHIVVVVVWTHDTSTSRESDIDLIRDSWNDDTESEANVSSSQQ
jgi:hypothetical protein